MLHSTARNGECAWQLRATIVALYRYPLPVRGWSPANVGITVGEDAITTFRRFTCFVFAGHGFLQAAVGVHPRSPLEVESRLCQYRLRIPIDNNNADALRRRKRGKSMGEAARPILLWFCMDRRRCDARLSQLVRAVPVPDADFDYLACNATAFDRILARSRIRAPGRACSLVGPLSRLVPQLSQRRAGLARAPTDRPASQMSGWTPLSKKTTPGWHQPDRR